MIRAGSLKEILIFEALTKEKTPSGAISKEYKEVFRCRAYRKKQSIITGDENAKEQFIGQMTVMLVRKYPQINYNCRVKWAECTWEIKMIEPRDNELTLTLKKLNI